MNSVYKPGNLTSTIRIVMNIFYTGAMRYNEKNVLCRFRAAVDDSIYKTYCVFLFFAHVHGSKSTQKCIHFMY